MSGARQTSFLPGPWLEVKDGNDTARSIFDQHYSRRHYRNRKPKLFVGPGEKLVLVTPDALAVWVWRKFISDAGQRGVNCAVFRNEGAGLSSGLIRAADAIAWERWPGERLYTYIDTRKIRRKRDPGRCFLRAGWRHAGWNKSGKLRILECWPPDISRALARCDQEIEEIRSRPDVVAGKAPAWLVTLGILDWEAEKRAIEREAEA